jgi:uncharacterized membrane protein YgdD (TMEM256/DUF423 family)
MVRSVRFLVALAGILGALGVGAGAFAAHALRGTLDSGLLAAFETGARYQLTHAVVILVVAWAAQRWPDRGWHRVGWLFVVGVALFSGSLYAMALSGIRTLGVITPFGGVTLIAAWLLLAWNGFRSRP